MNRMMTHAPMTTPMDVFGLQRRPNPLRHIPDNEPVLTITNKEDRTMRYNSNPLRNASRHEVVLTLKDDPAPQRRGTDYLLQLHNEATQRALDQDWCARVKRAYDAEQAVPLAKRHVPGFQKIY